MLRASPKSRYLGIPFQFCVSKSGISTQLARLPPTCAINMPGLVVEKSGLRHFSCPNYTVIRVLLVNLILFRNSFSNVLQQHVGRHIQIIVRLP